MTSWFRSVFYHSLCVAHEFFCGFFFSKFSFFSCFFLTHAALFCFLIPYVSFKSKHLASSNQDLVLKVPLDPALPKEARVGLFSILNPQSVLWLEKLSFWQKTVISDFIFLQSSFPLSPLLFIFVFVLSSYSFFAFHVYTSISFLTCLFPLFCFPL